MSTIDQSNNPHAIRARRLMYHYFAMIAEKVGIRWDSDNRSETMEIVDEILAAAADAAQATAEYHYQQDHGEHSIIAMLQTEHYKEKR